MLFGPVPSTAPLGSPQVLVKPDLVATDCVQNTVLGSGSPRRFCGTSNAAPHAAAVAALLLDAKATLTPSEVGAALRSTAVAVGTAPPTVVGAGLVDAAAAVASVAAKAPALTGPATATLVVGAAGQFQVTATGLPVPTLSLTGGLPAGVTFNPATGALGGTPAAGTAGRYDLTVTAANGVAPNAVQASPSGWTTPLRS